MLNKSERWFYWLKVLLFSSWFGFACVWAMIMYLGFRVEGRTAASGLMGLAGGLNGPEIVAAMFLPPLGLLVLGCLVVNCLTRMQARDEIRSIQG